MSRKRSSSDRSSLASVSEQSFADNESSGTDNSEQDSIPLKRLKGIDAYCWLCHKGNTNRRCSACIRSYHNQCIGLRVTDQLKCGYRCELCSKMTEAINDYQKRYDENDNNIMRCRMHRTQQLIDQLNLQKC